MKILLFCALLLCIAPPNLIANDSVPAAVPEKASLDTTREFHSAVAAGDGRLVTRMLSEYPDLASAPCPNDDPGKQVQPIFTAIDHGHPAMIDLLIKHGGSFARGPNGQSPLDRATVLGTMEVVKTLLDAGANIDGLDNTANSSELNDPAHGTPLRDAVLNEHFDIARLLVQRGAHVDLQSAAGLGWTTWVTRQITAHPEQTDILDGWKYTPLCYAVDGGCAGTAQVLLDHGANINHTFDDGQTLLELASASGYHDLIVTLLSHGANVNAKNKAGETAIDYAMKYKQQDTVDLLRDHGGKRGLELP